MTKMKNNLVGVLIIALGLVIGNLMTNTITDYVENKDKPLEYQMIEVIDNAPAYNVEPQDFIPNMYESPIIIFEESTKDNPSGFRCSGIVISNDYALTAAHCLIDRKTNRMSKELTLKNALKSSSSAFDHSQKIIPAAVNRRADYGLVKGDFSLFSKTLIETSPGYVGVILVSKLVSACGNAWGGEFACMPSLPVNFTLCGDTLCNKAIQLFPGMSGGPLTAMTPIGPVVIAVNRGFGTQGAVFSPLVGLFESLGIDVVK